MIVNKCCIEGMRELIVNNVTFVEKKVQNNFQGNVPDPYNTQPSFDSTIDINDDDLPF